MGLGISPREVSALTLFDLRDLQDYWHTCPPPHVLIAAYLGALKDEGPKRPSTRSDVEKFAQQMGIPVKHG